MKNEIERESPVKAGEWFCAVAAVLWVLCIAFVLALFAGCATKTRNVEIAGMFVQADSSTLAIGSVDVMAAPVGEESAIIKYGEDTAWLSPSTKTHSIRIQLTGSNCTSRVDAIVGQICNAYVSCDSPCRSTTNAVAKSAAASVVESVVSPSDGQSVR